jgi:hypothetical protein
MKELLGNDRIQGIPFWKRPQIGRRLFFRHVASAAAGYFLLPARPMETVAQAAPPLLNKARNCIFILMVGGPSHIDTFDLKEGAWTPAEFNPTSYGDIRFPQGLMPKLAEQMDSLVFVRSVKPWAAVHQLAQTWVQIGRNPTNILAKIAPHIGSVVSMEMSAQEPDVLLPRFLSLNSGTGPANGYFPAEHAPFFFNPNGSPLPNTTHRDGQARFEQRFDLAMRLDEELRTSAPLGSALEEIAVFTQQAKRLVYSSEVEQVFALDGDDRDRYAGVLGGGARNSFADACVTARNLLRDQLGTRFIQINFGGWDNHSNIYTTALNAANLNAVGRRFDFAVGNLIQDLRTLGRLDDTLIVCMGEFGRTVGNPNGQSGRDHFLQQSVMMAGAQIPGGRFVGATDDAGRITADPGWSRRDRALPAGPDIRPEDLEATIYSALGIDYTTVRRDDPLGRGFEYVPFSDRDIYGPVNEIWES